MKRFLPYLILLVAGLWLGVSWIVPKPKADDFDVASFSSLPVLAGGRIKPLDTVARNSLLIMRGKQTLRLPNSKPMDKPMEASRWLADVLFNARVADTYPVFSIANQEVLDLCGLPQADKRDCTFAELEPSLEKIEEEVRRASKIESAKRSPYQKAIHHLYDSLDLYLRLKNSVQLEKSGDLGAEINFLAKCAAAARQGEHPFDNETITKIDALGARWEKQSQLANMLTSAPLAGGRPDDWQTTGAALFDLFKDQKTPPPAAGSPAADAIAPSVAAYAAMGDAFRAGNRASFAQAADNYLGWTRDAHPKWASKAVAELRFNQMAPFYQGMVLYVGAFLLVVFSWLVLPDELRRAAVLILLLAFAVQTFGMVSRMWLQGRPPVTNLYSSAILVGWGAVVMAMVLESFFRYGIALACACVVGFVTLLIAHHLSSNGDTLEMQNAVLDSNIWLATHVVVITLGYSAMFLAGFLAVLHVVLNLLTCNLDRNSLAIKGACVIILAPLVVFPLGALIGCLISPTDFSGTWDQIFSFKWWILGAALVAVFITFGLVIILDMAAMRHRLLPKQVKDLTGNLTRMVYGIICFATLFSFVGTVLGGIWADQSWGRFWGWDPKENGALLIVLWCALTLHARWGGFIRQRGFMAMAIGGNAITAFSWFGVNMLNVGLHSYGFMEQALPWLSAFVSFQIVLALISLHKTSASVRPPPLPGAPPMPEEAG